MNVRFGFLSAAAVAAALSALPPRAAAAPEDECLIRLVRDRSARVFVSLVPFSPDDPVGAFSLDARRLPAWRDRVKTKRDGGIDRVEVFSWTNEVGVVVDSSVAGTSKWFLDLMGAGGTEIRGAADAPGGADAAQTFRVFRPDGISATPYDARVVLQNRGGPILRPDRGFDAVWVFPWEEVRETWDAKLRSGKAEDRRVVLAAWREIRAARCAEGVPGAAAWAERLDAYWTNAPALWPGFYIQNDRDEPVRVRYRKEGARAWQPSANGVAIGKGARHEAAAPADPRKGCLVQWQFKTEGGDGTWDDCADQEAERIDEDHLAIYVASALRPFKRDPRLRLDDFFPAGVSATNATFSVQYAAGGGKKSEDAELPVEWDGKSPFLPLRPGRAISEVRLHALEGWASEQAVETDKNVYHCGDEGRPRAALRLLPWPTLTIENATPAATNVEVRCRLSTARQDGDAVSLRAGARTLKTAEDWIPGLGAAPTNVVEVVLSATVPPGFEPWERKIALRRGAEAETVKIELEPRSLNWPDAKKIKAVFQKQNNLSSVLTDGGTTAASKWPIEEKKEYVKKSFAEVTASEEFKEVVRHLDECRDPACKKRAHAAFVRQHPDAVRAAPGPARDAELFFALWQDSYEEISKAVYKGDQTKGDCLREWLELPARNDSEGGKR